MRANRIIVLSDMHFGMAESSVNNPEVIKGMQEFMLSQERVDEVIFSGDLLDLNLSTFTKSIEGTEELFGFRQFLVELVDACGSWAETCKWVYVPGNHDYRVWNMLSEQIVCADVLARGDKMGSVKTPLKSYCWQDGEAFIAGVFPEKVRKNVILDYPDHLLGESRVLVTHGHYLDPKQTLFTDFEEFVKEQGSVEKAMRAMFIETAQYQAIAGSVSYTEKWRNRINAVVGPSSVWGMVKVWFSGLFGDEKNPLVSGLRGDAIDVDQLRAIEFYLKFFREYEDPPEYFVYGHTHVQDHSSTANIPVDDRLYKDKEIEVFNVGALYPHDGTVATFLVIEVEDDGEVRILPHYVDEAGNAEARE